MNEFASGTLAANWLARPFRIDRDMKGAWRFGFDRPYGPTRCDAAVSDRDFALDFLGAASKSCAHAPEAVSREN